METTTIITLQNKQCIVSIDSFGGAFTGFQLLDNPANPLAARFTKDQMPENNKAGAVYQGHFLCLGRWGLPSDGEIKAGLPNHGQVANIQWMVINSDDTFCTMEVHAPLEGLQVQRTVQLHASASLFEVTEAVSNLNPLARLYNMVQHPMLSPPFLDQGTVVNSNAAKGFNQAYKNSPEQFTSEWPFGTCEDGTSIDLQNITLPYNAVFSFVVNEDGDIGWVTAFSPSLNLLFGYVWNRKDYPWIHLWQHWKNDILQYRGIEFGTAGIHKPFKELLEDAPELFGCKTYACIDAGEKITKKYDCFLVSTESSFVGVEHIKRVNDAIHIKPLNGLAEIIIQANFSHDISK